MNKIAIALLLFGLTFLVSLHATTAAPMRIYIDAHTFKPLSQEQISTWNDWKIYGSFSIPTEKLNSPKVTGTVRGKDGQTCSPILGTKYCEVSKDWQGNTVKGYEHCDSDGQVRCYPFVKRGGSCIPANSPKAATAPKSALCA